jgi:hypothetical protein
MTVDANAELAKRLFPRISRVYISTGKTAATAEIAKLKTSIGKGASGLDPSADLTSLLSILEATSDT